MQPLTAAPRDGLSEAQVRAILTDGSLVDAGLDLLDPATGAWSDITGDLLDGTVERDCLATIHGTCRLQLTRQLPWGTLAAQVRPWQSLTARVAGAWLTARWRQGVFILTSPDDKAGLTPRVWDAQGYDRLYFLAQPIGDSYAVPAGTDVLTAVAAVIAAAGAPGVVLVDGSARGKTLATDMVWPLTESSQPTFLGVANDLLDTLAYRGLWVDQDGNYRLTPYAAPGARGIEWEHTADDKRLTLLTDDRTRSVDTFAIPNWWRFIQKGLTSVPSEGAGQVTVANLSDGPTSQTGRGYLKRAPVAYVDAPDQVSLAAQAAAAVAASRATTTLIKVTTGPFPGLGHWDVSRLTDSTLGSASVTQCRSWSNPLRGVKTTQTWEVAA